MRRWRGGWDWKRPGRLCWSDLEATGAWRNGHRGGELRLFQDQRWAV